MNIFPTGEVHDYFEFSRLMNIFPMRRVDYYYQLFKLITNIPLPKGINKIIKEYSFYEVIFKYELRKETISIFTDTSRWWSYDKYYADYSEVRKTKKPFKITKYKNEWIVGG